MHIMGQIIKINFLMSVIETFSFKKYLTLGRQGSFWKSLEVSKIVLKEIFLFQRQYQQCLELV